MGFLSSIPTISNFHLSGLDRLNLMPNATIGLEESADFYEGHLIMGVLLIHSTTG